MIAAATRRSTLADVIALGKPRITFMVLITTLTGLWLAPGTLAPSLTLAALFGITLVVAGANALNMYLERDTDALMKRTRTRPLPAGRMSPDVALRAGILASVLAIGLLTFGINPLTGLLAALSLALYVLAYTPFKRRSTRASVARCSDATSGPGARASVSVASGTAARARTARATWVTATLCATRSTNVFSEHSPRNVSSARHSATRISCSRSRRPSGDASW